MSYFRLCCHTANISCHEKLAAVTRIRARNLWLGSKSEKKLDQLSSASEDAAHVFHRSVLFLTTTSLNPDLRGRPGRHRTVVWFTLLLQPRRPHRVRYPEAASSACWKCDGTMGVFTLAEGAYVKGLRAPLQKQKHAGRAPVKSVLSPYTFLSWSASLFVPLCLSEYLCFALASLFLSGVSSDIVSWPSVSSINSHPPSLTPTLGVYDPWTR